MLRFEPEPSRHSQCLEVETGEVGLNPISVDDLEMVEPNIGHGSFGAVSQVRNVRNHGKISYTIYSVNGGWGNFVRKRTFPLVSAKHHY